MTREWVGELISRHRAGDTRARDQLVAGWQGLVRRVVCPLAGRHSVDDLVQEGNMGLMVAIDKFDPTRGVLFSTYAVNWVRAYVWKFVGKNGAVRRTKDGRYLTLPSVSIDAPMGDDDARTLLDTFISADQPADEGLEGHQARLVVRDALERIKGRLTGLPYDIVKGRLMRDGADAMTLDDLGQRHGVSREYVRQVEKKTLALLARYMAPLREVIT